jgi:hypothetical protein
VDFRATEQREAQAVSDFLARVFHLEKEAPLLAGRHMHWKYWAARPDWPGSRSFTCHHGGAIVAHAAAWPVRLRMPGRVVDAVHLIDWAADPACPGAGIWLLRQIRAKVSLAIATGGREITSRILPVVGFKKHGELCLFARPVRPLTQAMTACEKNWRLLPRLARNTAWCVTEPLAVPPGWSAMPIEPEDVPERLWPQPSTATAVTSRDAGVFRFYVDSPSTRHTLWGLLRHAELIGYFCLSFAPHVARIADLWLPSTRVDDWCAAFKTAAVMAARDAGVCEISAWASTAIGKEALARAGFRLRDCAAVTISGGAGALHGRELHMQMLDCDASFLNGGEVSYLT